MTTSVLVALQKEGAELSDVLNGLGQRDFDRPTNCPPWSLRELIVHIADSLHVPVTLPSAPADQPLKSAADYYRREERVSTAYRQRNVEEAQQAAQRPAPRADPASYFSQAAGLSIERLASEDLASSTSRGLGRCGWMTTLRRGSCRLQRMGSTWPSHSAVSRGQHVLRSGSPAKSWCLCSVSSHRLLWAGATSSSWTRGPDAEN